MRSRAAVFMGLTALVTVMFLLFAGAATADADGGSASTPAAAGADAKAPGAAKGTGDASAGDARADAGPELDPYSAKWHEQARKCERFAVDPIVRLLHTAPSRDRVEDLPRHSAIFAKTAAELRARAENVSKGKPTRPPGKVEYLIAIVPDPIQSGMFYSSDRVVEAVSRGIEATSPEKPQRWLRDRYWSPWVDDNTLVEDADKKLMVECRRRMPGVLTFRDDVTFGLGPTSDLPQALVVFIVGESPISGVNKFALREALDFIAMASPGLEEVRILGPTYSGSASSLWLALRFWRRPQPPDGAPAAPRPPCFTIVSGTVTRSATKDRLDTCSTSDDALSCKDACKSVTQGPRLSFHAATVPDGLRLRAFYTYLVDNLGIPKDESGHPCRLRHVALLKERSTAYSVFAPAAGAKDAGTDSPEAGGAKDVGAKSPEAHKADASTASHARDASAAPDDDDDDDAADPYPDARYELRTDRYEERDEGVGCVPELELSFPPHISNVRRAHDAQRKSATRTAGNDESPSSGPALIPSLDEPAEPRDVIPNLSPRTTYSNDLLLENIIDTLADHDIRYVGLFATDRSDIIFLASQIHRNANDARLFTFASELLYAHPAYEASLNGMMVASTYPLLADHQPTAGRVDVFSGEQEQGVYNATLALLGKRTAMREYGGTANGLPPVWISVIGRGGAFPLAEFETKTDDKRFMVHGVPTTTPPTPDPVPRLWRITFVIVSIGILYVAGVHLASRTLDRWRREMQRRKQASSEEPEAPLRTVPNFPPLASLFYPCESPRVALRKEAATTALFAFMLASYTPFVALHRASTESALGAAVGTAVAISLASSVRRLFLDWRQRRGETVAGHGDRRVDDFLCLAALGSAAAGTLLAAHVIASARGIEGGTSSFCRRAVALGSGVSPMTPLLFAMAIVLLWAVCTIDRLRMVDGLCMKSGPATSPDQPPISQVLALSAEGAPKDIEALEDELRRSVMAPSRDLLGRTILVPIVVFAFWVFCFLDPLSTLEGHATSSVLSANRLAALTIALCATLIADTVLSIAQVFWRLRALLRRLARHSLADAYARLPPSLTRTLEQQLSGSVPDVNELAIPVLQLRVLKKGGEPLGDLPERAMNAFEKERDQLARSSGYIVLGASSTVRLLIDAAAIVLGRLRVDWDSRTPVSLGYPTSKRDPSDGSSPTSSAGERAAGAAPDSAKAVGGTTARELCECYVACLVTMFLHQYVRVFRPMMVTAVGGAVLLLLLIASYAFEPRHLILAFLWLLVLSAAAVVAYVFVELDKDELLSRVAKSTPGRVTIDRGFIMRTLTWAALPIFSLIAVQYPTVADALWSWIKPLIKGGH